MLHLTDDMIERLVSASEAESVLRSAFIDFAGGRAAMQARARTEAGGVKLSTLGAVIPGQGVTGAKVYTTINGQFRFVILLFSTEDGRPLACLDAGTITRIRTAACSLLAARELAPERPQRMALFGAGVQGSAHAEQFSRAFGLGRIAVCDPYAKPETIALLQSRCEAEVDVASPEEAVRDADIVVTASRSTEPLFSGAWLKPGSFVAAIGSSLPHTRELDDACLERAEALVVEWREQAMQEAGDIVRAGPSALPPAKIHELGAVLAGTVRPRRSAEDIVIYKAVGVGLQDVALAGVAYRRFIEERG